MRLASAAGGRLFLRLNAVEVFLRADEEGAVRRRVGRQRALPQRVLRQQFVLRARLDHVAVAALTLDIDFAVAVQGRRGEAAAEPLLPVLLARLGVQAR